MVLDMFFVICVFLIYFLGGAGIFLRLRDFFLNLLASLSFVFALVVMSHGYGVLGG